jgi:hypothetical protein
MNMLKLNRFNVEVKNGTVKFYDHRYTNDTDWINGQPVSAYYSDTLMEHDDGVGLDLDGGVDGWEIDGAEMDQVKAYIKGHPEALIGFWNFFSEFEDSRKEVADLRTVPVVGDNYVDVTEPVPGCVYLDGYYIYQLDDGSYAVDLENSGEHGDRYKVELALAKYAYRNCEVRA